MRRVAVLLALAMCLGITMAQRCEPKCSANGECTQVRGTCTLASSCAERRPMCLQRDSKWILPGLNYKSAPYDGLIWSRAWHASASTPCWRCDERVPTVSDIERTSKADYCIKEAAGAPLPDKVGHARSQAVACLLTLCPLLAARRTTTSRFASASPG
jgi:hypothetical protein